MQQPESACIQCGRLHTMPYSFCSSECCGAWLTYQRPRWRLLGQMDMAVRRLHDLLVAAKSRFIGGRHA